MAFHLGVQCVEGLIRNRYTGRTFIEGASGRAAKAEAKYTPLREVLEGRRVLLVEDSIVRSTTMRVLLSRIRKVGGAREVHVRVACPPIIAPCFYGIDMSTIGELFAPPFVQNGAADEAAFAKMAADVGAESLRYLPIDSIARAIGKPVGDLCQACITSQYPTPFGQELYEVALEQAGRGANAERTYETVVSR
jgi:amidophosphoribosyltransferase